MLPNASGTGYAAAYGEPAAFHWTRTLDPAWDAGEIETVVFIQSVSTRQVFQTASTFGTTPAR